MVHDPRDVRARLLAEGPAGFAPVVQATSPRLYRLALRLLGVAADAEDAVQEGYARAYDALVAGRYDEREKLEGWLVAIVTRVSIDMLRSRKPRVPDDTLVDTPASGPDEDSLASARDLSRMLDDLPPDQRAAVVLKMVEGMTSAEVGRALGVSEGAVEQRLLRARATLRKKVLDG